MIATMCLRYSQQKEVNIDYKLKLLKKSLSLLQELNDTSINNNYILLCVSVNEQLSKTYLELEKKCKGDAKEHIDYVTTAIDHLSQAMALIRSDIESYKTDPTSPSEISESVVSDLNDKLNEMRKDCFIAYVIKAQIHV